MIKKLSFKHRVITMAIWLAPLLARAQEEPQGPNGPPSMWANLLWTVLPFAVIAVLFWFFFGRAWRKGRSQTNEFIATQREHYQRQEQLLERIARALEGHGKDPE